ncbi:hypothetical protein BD310DRAFT_934830 [Dichomitus squalens]|uniref:Uncharacterized protein n=1 Tax=Dichomitus squalens TaxID=114155 RepID=A0A4V6MWP4_9APHY|nr:hypothetical protein BD310DRAFT_934830 [Dichomitus squalens]
MQYGLLQEAFVRRPAGYGASLCQVVRDLSLRSHYNTSLRVSLRHCSSLQSTISLRTAVKPHVVELDMLCQLSGTSINPEFNVCPAFFGIPANGPIYIPSVLATSWAISRETRLVIPCDDPSDYPTLQTSI